MIKPLYEFVGESQWGVRTIVKMFALLLVGTIAITVLLAIVIGLFRMAFGHDTFSVSSGVAYSPSTVEIPGGASDSASSGQLGEMMNTQSNSAIRDMVPSVIAQQHTSSVSNPEKYERIGYDLTYETRQYADTCDAIEALKPLDYVLFDTANRTSDRCAYEFRVASSSAESVLAKLKTLNPDTVAINTQTVSQTIDDTNDRINALIQQRDVVDATLKQTEQAYDDAIKASHTNGISNLASLVTDKLNSIERLTNERLSIDESIRSLQSGNGSTINDTQYTHFSVSVSRIVYVDLRSINATWRYALQSMISDSNDALADILLGLPVILLRTVWVFAIAFFGIVVLVLFARLTRDVVKRIWFANK